MLTSLGNLATMLKVRAATAWFGKSMVITQVSSTPEMSRDYVVVNTQKYQ